MPNILTPANLNLYSLLSESDKSGLLVKIGRLKATSKDRPPDVNTEGKQHRRIAPHVNIEQREQESHVNDEITIKQSVKK